MAARTDGATLKQSGAPPAGGPLAGVRGLGRRWSEIGPLIATSALPFLLVFYLAMQGGGYDDVVRGEIGVAIWWLVLLGAIAGVLPSVRIARGGWIAIGLLAAFTAWTALAIGWSESSERSVVELGRVATLLGVLVLALATQGRDGLRRTVYAVGAAIALVGSLALLSRLHPAWFPDNDVAAEIPSTESRLAYPLNYWNGLAALLAMGVPLLLVGALRARAIVTQALASAAIPIVMLAGFLTFSRGGIVALAIALGAFFILAPNRLAAMPTLALTGLGSALLIASAAQRDALEDGLLTDVARSQGDEMIAITLVVCIGVALVQVAISLAARHGIGPRPTISRRNSLIALGGAAVVALVVALAAGGPGLVDDAFEESKDPYGAQAQGAERLSSTSLSGRYDLWESSLDAGASEPLAGIGPGTFEFWWAREGTEERFVRDAHSLFLESFAELGAIGLLLIVAAIGFPLAIGVRRALRASAEQRILLAAAVAGGAAFVVVAAIDWMWELTVVPLAFLLLAAAIVGTGNHERSRAGSETDRERSVVKRSRIGLAVMALLSLVAVAIPLATIGAVRDSQADVRALELDGALDEADAAQRIGPYAATADLQRALVLELQGDLPGARDAAAAATESESTNWRNWLVLSRLEARLGNAAGAVDAYEQARSLNPRSPIFANGTQTPPDTEATQ